MKANAPSATALRVAALRALHQTQDAPPIFIDRLAERILGRDGPALLATYRAEARTTARLRGTLAARAVVAEETIAEAAGHGVTQCVILGAGLDTFAYRHRLTGLRVFEVDHPATQGWKRGLLADAGIQAPDDVAFVAMQFERDDLFKALRGAGFDPARPAVFAMLGVVLYVDRMQALATFAAIAARAASGSTLHGAVRRRPAGRPRQLSGRRDARRRGRRTVGDVLRARAPPCGAAPAGICRGDGRRCRGPAAALLRPSDRRIDDRATDAPRPRPNLIVCEDSRGVMSMTADTKTDDRPRVRGGRPTKAAAAARDERLLEIATRMFLDQGFDATSMDGLAEAASIGKATLYARYADKGALFVDVLRRGILQVYGPIEEEFKGALAHAELEPMLRRVARRLLAKTTSAESIALGRILAAQAPRFPDLARLAVQEGWGRQLRLVENVLAHFAREHRFASDDLPQLADLFISIVIGRSARLAMFGVPVEPKALEVRADAAVAHFVRGLLAEPLPGRTETGSP